MQKRKETDMILGLVQHAQQLAYYAELAVVWTFAFAINVQNAIAPESGVCSFYAEAFHGRETASGTIYDMDGMTCAHCDLPLGTRVLFVNWENGRMALLRVEDRGPYLKVAVDGVVTYVPHPVREFDISKGAAEYLSGGDLDRGLYYLSYRPLWRDTRGLAYNL